MSVDISIIVPVYNLESYLPKCINSILNQTFTNIELILVNDGSTDRSGTICDYYMKQDQRVKVVHKENGGVASARNAGLEIAQGHYIGFVDNDDYINEYMFEILYYYAIQSEAHITVCDYIKVGDTQSHIPERLNSNYDIHSYDNMEALDQLYTANRTTFVVPWNKLYKRQRFHQVQYKLGNIHDDETVAHELLYYSEKTTYIQIGLYYCGQREGSQTDVSAPCHVNVLDAIYAFKERELFFRNKKLHDLHERSVKQFMERFFWYYFLVKENVEEADHHLALVKKSFNVRLIYMIKHPHLSLKQKLMCIVFVMSPRLFEWLKLTNEKRSEKFQSPSI